MYPFSKLQPSQVQANMCPALNVMIPLSDPHFTQVCRTYFAPAM